MKLITITSILALLVVTLVGYYVSNETYQDKSYAQELCRDKVMQNYELKWNKVCYAANNGSTTNTSNCKIPEQYSSQIPSWDTYKQQMHSCNN